MGGIAVRLSIACAAGVGLLGGTARAQAVPGTAAAPRLSLGISAGAPGSETEVQVKLAAPSDMAIARIDAVLTVPAVLEFKEITGSMIAAGIVKSRATFERKHDGPSELRLSLETGRADATLPGAVLANVGFTVSREATPGVLNLGLKATAFARDGRELGALEAFEGRINIQEPEVFYGCFFYMH